MLYDIVPKLVISQIIDVHHDLIQYRSRLFISAVLQYPLNNSTSICMDAQAIDIVSDGNNDEVKCLRRHLLNALLDNVVAVLVVDAVKNSIFQFTHQQLLLRERDDFECFLDYSAPVHGLGEFEDIAKQLVC
jgi:hypothetical protein